MQGTKLEGFLPKNQVGFFSENWRKFSVLLMKNNNSIKIKPWFQFEVFFYWEDENNWLFKPSKAPTNPILKIE